MAAFECVRVCRLAEFIKDKESDHQTANNLEELAAGGGKTRKAAKVSSWVCC